MTEDMFWQTIFKATESTPGYKESFETLSRIAPGYALCFAFHYVDADICNGGISQLRANSTWSLILAATEACHRAKANQTERLLKEMVLYYHERGRSRRKRQLTEDFFARMDRPLQKSLSQLEDAYFDLEQERDSVIPSLLSDPSLWPTETPHGM